MYRKELDFLNWIENEKQKNLLQRTQLVEKRSMFGWIHFEILLFFNLLAPLIYLCIKLVKEGLH